MNSVRKKAWVTTSIIALVVPPLAALGVAFINGNELQDSLRDVVLGLLVVALVCVVVSFVSIFYLVRGSKLTSIVAVLLNIPITYLIFYSYSFSFYSY